MNKNAKSIIVRVLFLLLGVGLVFLSLRNTDLNKLWHDISGADFRWLVPAALVILSAHFIRAYRWNMLLKPLGHHIKLRRAFYAVMSGYLVNVATSRGGEIVRALLVNRTDKVPVDKSTGTIITERIIDLLMMALFSLLCFAVQMDVVKGFVEEKLFNGQPSEGSGLKWIILASLFVFGIAGIIMLKKLAPRVPLFKKILSIVNGLFDGLKSVFKMEKKAIFWAQSVYIWLAYLVTGWIIFYALPFTSHFGLPEALSLLLFSSLGIIVPIPGNLGPLLFNAQGFHLVYGLPEEQAYAMAALQYAFQNIIVIGVGSVCSLLMAYENIKTKTA